MLGAATVGNAPRAPSKGLAALFAAIAYVLCTVVLLSVELDPGPPSPRVPAAAVLPSPPPLETAGAAAWGGRLHACTCLTAGAGNADVPATPTRLRWLHFPKTGTSFVATLWSYAASTRERYIDLAASPYVCGPLEDAAHHMYDFALMRRYPWEVYGARNLIPPSRARNATTGRGQGGAPRLGLVGGTQHAPIAISFLEWNNLELEGGASSAHLRRVRHALRKSGSEIFDFNITVAAFFRRPEDRLVSAFYDGRHANGLPPALFRALTAASVPRGGRRHACRLAGGISYRNPLECYARFPGIAGCMARMLTGEKCADGVLREAGTENLPSALAALDHDRVFVGLVEEWNESICQFHRMFAGKVDFPSGRRLWDPPLQGEFSNVHKSTEEKLLGVEHMHGFKDEADEAVYAAAQRKFAKMVGNERCYKYMTVEEIIARQRANHTGLPILTSDDGGVCKPLSCSELGKQCGEWDDGCGRTVICGMCDAARTGLPSTWRVACVEGRCVDYCPPWADAGYWFPNQTSDLPPGFAAVLDDLRQPRRPPDRREPLSPVEAVQICETACTFVREGRAGRLEERGLHPFVGLGLCRCGNAPKMLQANLTRQDFAVAHNLEALCRDEKARKDAILAEWDTQPVCCPPPAPTPPVGWSRGALRRLNVEGEYFAHVHMACGAFMECEQVARRAGAEMAVFDVVNNLCYLARNLFQLGDGYVVTKDNGHRYFFDLRKKRRNAA